MFFISFSLLESYRCQFEIKVKGFLLSASGALDNTDKLFFPKVLTIGWRGTVVLVTIAEAGRAIDGDGKAQPTVRRAKGKAFVGRRLATEDMEGWIGSASIKSWGVRLVFGERRTILERTLSHSPFWHKQVG